MAKRKNKTKIVSSGARVLSTIDAEVPLIHQFGPLSAESTILFNQIVKADLLTSIHLLASVLVGVRDDLKELREDVKDLRDDVKDLRDDVKDLREDVKVLKRNVSSLNRNISSINIG